MGRAQVSHGERKKWDLASTWDVGLTSENKTEEITAKTSYISLKKHKSTNLRYSSFKQNNLMHRKTH